MWPVSRRGRDHSDRLELSPINSAGLRIRLAQGDHGHHSRILDHRHRENYHRQRRKPERYGSAVSVEEWKRHDRDADPQCLRHHSKECGNPYLTRVVSCVYEETRRIEQRRLQYEVHREAYNHLNDEQGTDGAASATLSLHDPLLTTA